MMRGTPMSMHREARLERSFVVAVASHLAAAAALAAVPFVPTRPLMLLPARVEAMVEVSLEREEVGRGEPPPEVGLPERTEPRVAARPPEPGRATTSARERAAPEVAAAPTSPDPEASIAALEGASSPSWTFAPTVAAPVVGRTLAGSREGGGASAGEGGEASGSTAAGAGALASVRSGLAAHDRRTGLSPGGALVDATGDVVRASRVPVKAHARIEVRADARGVVTSVRVLDVSSDMDAWEEAAKQLVASLRARPLRVPSGADGLVVTLRVESSLRLPSAHEAGPVKVSVLHVPVKPGAPGKGAQVNVSPLGASIDSDPTDMLLDATSLPRRVVSVTVADEERL